LDLDFEGVQLGSDLWFGFRLRSPRRVGLWVGLGLGLGPPRQAAAGESTAEHRSPQAGLRQPPALPVKPAAAGLGQPRKKEAKGL
jgi:hypothetical protein